MRGMVKFIGPRWSQNHTVPIIFFFFFFFCIFPQFFLIFVLILALRMGKSPVPLQVNRPDAARYQSLLSWKETKGLIILLCWYGSKDSISYCCRVLYGKPGGHKIVCTGVKFKSCFNVVENHTNRFLLLYDSENVSFDLSTTYRFVVIEGKVKGQIFGTTGVKQDGLKMFI